MTRLNQENGKTIVVADTRTAKFRRKKMPSKYDQEAIEHCRKIYCKHGGINFDAIENEMREKYPNWVKGNLIDKGKGRAARFGWITKHNFEKSLQEHLKTQVVAVSDDVQKLYLGIKKTRETLEAKVTGEKASPSRDDIYAYRDFCKLEMEARNRLELEKDNYESFVACFEKLLAWLPDIDPKAATAFLSGDTAERILAKARVEYGEESKSDS